MLHDIRRDASVAFVNCHLEGDPLASLKRVQQLQSALHGVRTATTEAPHVSLVVAGDFNSTADSTVAAYLAFGSVPPGTRDAWGRAGITSACSSEVSAEVLAVPEQTYRLKSVYGMDDPHAFSFAPNGRRGWHGLLDHIWHDQRHLRCVGRRPLFASEAERCELLDRGMPSATAPSDHLPCGATFRWSDTVAGSQTAPLFPAESTTLAPDATADQLLAEAAELVAACPFASDDVRDEWLAVTTASHGTCKGKPTADELATIARQRERKEALLAEVSPEARDILMRVLQLQKDAKKAASKPTAEQLIAKKHAAEAKRQQKATAAATARAADAAAANSPAPTEAASTSSVPSAVAQQDFEFVAILDFEKTCDRAVALTPQEIIEVPTLLLRLSACGEAALVAEFHEFARPTHHPTLSDFCTELTGIQQAQVHAASLLHEVLAHSDGTNVLVVTCGDYDLKRSLVEDPNVDHTSLPACYRRWSNLKKAYATHTKQKKQPAGMAEMLAALGLELEGHHHSGIDDCRNLANVVRALLRLGWKVGATGQREE